MTNDEEGRTTRCKKPRILLFKLGSLGDTLMTTPLLRQLRKAFPDAIIDYWIGEKSAVVLKHNPNIDSIVLYDESIFIHKQVLKLFKLIAKIKKGNYDCIFVLDKHWIFNMMAWLAHIPVRIGFDRLGKEGRFLTKNVYYGNDKHEVYYYLDLLKAYTNKIDANDTDLDLRLTASDLHYAEKIWKKYGLEKKTVITVAPGGGKNAGETTEIRNWPVARYAQLLQMIPQDYFIILVGSKDDALKEKDLLPARKKNIISVMGKTSLQETAAMMKKSSIVLCNDSGAMHIASAVNKRIISLFGPTDPKRKAPLHVESIALWKDQKKYYPPYELFGRKPEQTDFFSGLTPEMVRHALQKLVKII